MPLPKPLPEHDADVVEVAAGAGAVARRVIEQGWNHGVRGRCICCTEFVDRRVDVVAVEPHSTRCVDVVWLILIGRLIAWAFD